MTDFSDAVDYLMFICPLDRWFYTTLQKIKWELHHPGWYQILKRKKKTLPGIAEL
jgi:hypothetical protein